MTDQTIDTPSDDPVIIITRTFDAPRALMFKLFTDPYHLVRFWGPEGSTYPVCEMDVRPGGQWRLTMLIPVGPAALHASCALLQRFKHSVSFSRAPDGAGEIMRSRQVSKQKLVKQKPKPKGTRGRIALPGVGLQDLFMALASKRLLRPGRLARRDTRRGIRGV